jgi:hypothetical protein
MCKRDLSRVRIQTDTEAAISAGSVQAHASTQRRIKAADYQPTSCAMQSSHRALAGIAESMAK